MPSVSLLPHGASRAGSGPGWAARAALPAWCRQEGGRGECRQLLPNQGPARCLRAGPGGGTWFLVEVAGDKYRCRYPDGPPANWGSYLPLAPALGERCR